MRGHNPSKKYFVSVYEWIEKLRNSHTNVMHEEEARHMFMATNENNIEHGKLSVY
jgi:hypothetical protein